MVVVIKKTKIAIALVLIICLFTVSGCWSRRELEALAYVLILGVDLTPEGKVKLIAQVGLPLNEPGAGDTSRFRTIIAEGVDMSNALDNMFLESTKSPDLTHVRLIVFSEEVARKGLWSLLDVLRRDVIMRSNIRVAISATDLVELLAVDEPLSIQPSLAIEIHFSSNIQRSATVEAELMDLVTEFLEHDRELVLPVIEIDAERFSLGQTAVFQRDKMLKILDRQQTFGILLWRNQVRGGIISIPQLGEDKVVSFRIIGNKTKVLPHWDGEKLHVSVYTDTVVDINEIHGGIQVDLEELVNTYIIQRMGNVLAVACEERSDFLNIGVHFRRSDPKSWKKLHSHWADILQEAEYSIQGRVQIRGQGQIR